jgi:hypothetical protein
MRRFGAPGGNRIRVFVAARSTARGLEEDGIRMSQEPARNGLGRSGEARHFVLRFPEWKIRDWAAAYTIDEKERRIEEVVAPKCQRQGYLDRDSFLELCRWKTPRTRRWCERNRDDFLKSVSAIAFSTSNERLRVEVLILLQGVDWPTASVLLHFAHRDPYPILDFRALWSLNAKVPRSTTSDSGGRTPRRAERSPGGAGCRCGRWIVPCGSSAKRTGVEVAEGPSPGDVPEKMKRTGGGGVNCRCVCEPLRGFCENNVSTTRR